MPLEDHKKAMDDGVISKKQYEKLPPHLLTAIIKSKKKNMKPVPTKKKKKK
tara:strand:+ start:1033 stop:1185 length:153 start_codon:yes stop_codon:yes gene_type:complete